MTHVNDHVVPYSFGYGAMPLEKRRDILPERNVCSLYPAENATHSFLTGNGRQSLTILGEPYHESVTFGHEALYEPLWAKTPEPPDLTGVMPDVRKLLLDGQFSKAADLIEQVQLEAGFGESMSTNQMGAIIPMGPLRKHPPFRLYITQPEHGATKNYLRWLDMLTGLVTVNWENDKGAYTREAVVSYKGDVCALKFTALTPGTLDVELDISLPVGGQVSEGPRGGLKHADKCTQKFTITEDFATQELAYAPEFGQKGYCSALRICRVGGTADVVEDKLIIKNADALVVIGKTVKFESGFAFGCSSAVLDELSQVSDFDALVAYNRDYLGSRMERSRIRLGDQDDFALSGEELLLRTHTEFELDPMLLEKLYDMGRFYQIIDTGNIPPMVGQHNINTNLQVCAGNNTGLFDEMDIYFKYYESKFDDFRTNAKKLFNARGLLASVHCDYDSGLFYHFSKTYPHFCWTGCLGWVFNELWGYYLVTGDKEFLRNRLIPALKEIALFFEDYACDRGPDGRVIFYPSFSPENPTPFSYVPAQGAYAASINSVMDIMICREVLDNLINGCNELGIEQENIAHWEDQRASLPRLLADEEGGLKEWAWYGVNENYNHRHVSHHYGLWPGHFVTWEENPDLAKAIQISNRKRGHQDDSAHGVIHRLFSAIRLKDVDDTIANLSFLMNHGYVTRALNTSHYPYTGVFPDLQGAMPAVLLEMCVFSCPGTVEFLPAMPKSLPNGSIQGIWLYTWAKLISMEWNAHGMNAVLVSNKAQTLTLRCRRNISSLRINGNKMPMVDGSVLYTFAEGEKVEIEIDY